VRADLPKLTPEQPTYNDEYRLMCSDGRVCWIYEQGTGIFNEQGMLSHLEGVMIDVTARKLADQAIEQERQQLRQIIQNAPLPMAMFDTEMHYIAHSDQWLTDYGLEGQSIIGRSHYEVLPNVPDHWRQAHTKALTGEIVSCEEDKFTRVDGSTAYLKWRLQPWYKTDGELGGIIRISQDIHQLVEAREAAIEASRLKSSFLANMSHEIRTPMNGILGIAELLQTTDLTPQQQDFVRTLNASANHLLTLINDILDFSKIEAGEMSLESISLDLVESVEAVAELLAFQAHSKKVELLTFIDPELSQIVEGDPVRLRQILTNLVGNAIKFTAAGSVSIRCTLVAQTTEDLTVRFEVKDTGIGIKPEDKQKLFRSFSQVDPSTTREYGGTGLGLAIAKQLVSMMDGEIGIESNWGEGSTFWFTVALPRLDTISCFPKLLPRKVLVIETNERSCNILRDYLTACGMEVDICHSLLEGLVILEQTYDHEVIFLALPIFAAQQEIKSVLGKLKFLLPLDRLVLLVSSVDYPLLKPWFQEQSIRHLIKPLQQQSLFMCLQDKTLIDNEFNVVHDELSQRNFFHGADGKSSEIEILLVEDTPVNQMVIRNQLQVLGFEKLDCVDNGREALVRLQQKNYDLVLMDCLMPELDGYETTAAIRQREKEGQHQLIVAMTANAMEGDREKCLEAGMDDYISKPTTIHSVQRVLRRTLNRLVSSDQENNGNNNSSAPIDLERLQYFYGENEVFQREMLQEILKAVPTYFSDLQTAVKAKDWGEMVYHAHRLKGTTATAGIDRVPTWLAELEEAIPLKDFDLIQTRMTQIETMLAKAMQFVEQKLQS
jgi:PAS domain S-box-containing protein